MRTVSARYRFDSMRVVLLSGCLFYAITIIKFNFLFLFIPLPAPSPVFLAHNILIHVNAGTVLSAEKPLGSNYFNENEWLLTIIWVQIVPMVVIRSHHCFKKWIGANLAPIHFLKQWWQRPLSPAGMFGLFKIDQDLFTLLEQSVKQLLEQQCF